MQVFNSLAQIAEAIGVSSSHLAHLLIHAYLSCFIYIIIRSSSLKPFSFSSKRNLSDSPTRAFTIQVALFIGVERYANRVPFLFIY